MIKAILIDCFGVLVGRGFEETYRTAGGDPDIDRAFINDMLGQTNLGLVSEDVFHEAMASRLGITLSAWQATLQRVELPNVELLEYVQKLHGSYKLAILSNANVGVIEYKIGKDWVQACFDDVIVSADIGLVKPDPEIYKYAANRLDVAPSECVFIDDNEMLLKPARELGMKTIFYKDFAQTKSELEKLLGATSQS
jgi:epoxide hydrolase-like predicted phosphatase